jgi:hypothetical protein
MPYPTIDGVTIPIPELFLIRFPFLTAIPSRSFAPGTSCANLVRGVREAT